MSVVLFAAGSLQAPLTDIAHAFERETGTAVQTAFGPSGLLRARIEAGERADVFASADMDHPEILARAGRADAVRLFARNTLCAIVRPGVTVTTETLLDVLLDPAVRVGTSTPKADPSGDYAWAVFERAEAVRPGAFGALDAKALKLTGGPDTAKPPAGRNPYGWIMDEGRADVFLTYRTNALLACREVPELRIVDLPEALTVGADYGLTVLRGASADAATLAAYILSPTGRAVLRGYGFGTP